MTRPGRLLLLTAALACTTQAHASGDFDCNLAWRLLHHSYSGCSNMAFLSPSNDTRINLLLLMTDLRGGATAPKPDATGAPLFTWDKIAYQLGTPADRAARKTDDVNAQATPAPAPSSPFDTAVQADNTLKPDEKAALLDAHKTGHNPGAAIQSEAARAYLQYLQAATAFTTPDFDKAAAAFASLTNAPAAWVKETSTYMVGRTLINRAQVGAFDDYGAFQKDWHADNNTVSKAEAALDKYLQQYPHGTYALSARGLKRRGYWLAQDNTRLAEEYGALMMLPPAARNVSDVDLAQEIDNKIATPAGAYGTPRDASAENTLLQTTHNPLLLAMLDLQAMRTDDPGPTATTTPATALALTELQRQKPDFASQPALYEFLLATHALYVENKPAEVLHLIPDAARQANFTYLQFSRQMLRGMALEATKDNNALGFWNQLLAGAKAPNQRPAIELAIAYHQERSGDLRSVFAPASPIHVPYLREVLLANIADADLLRTQATNTAAPKRERDIALFTLLYKEATHNKPADFLKDIALVPANANTDGDFALDSGVDYFFTATPSEPAAIPLGIFIHDKTDSNFACPGLRNSEQQLAQDSNNATAQLCLADFIRLNQPVTYLGSTSTPSDELGGTPSLFPGDKYIRMSTYTAVLTNPQATKNDKAFALYRAVYCYGPSGNNDCGGKDVPKSQRKAWFTTLKHDYAGTRWANALQYYW